MWVCMPLAHGMAALLRPATVCICRMLPRDVAQNLRPDRCPPFALTAVNAGQYAATQGKTGACDACPVGSAVENEANSECDICGPGTYQDQPGQSTCTVRVCLHNPQRCVLA